MTSSPSYQAALDYLYSFVDFSKTHTDNLRPENFDLKRMLELLRRLRDPHTRIPAIHIAGTKGKGSTAAFCSSALSAAGFHTGLYTSPHLQDFCERIRLDGAPISQEEFVQRVQAIEPHVAAVPGLSTFEITTALAFWWFALEGAEALVLEVGLGGRLDATNVAAPAVSVITSISLDHVPILGTTLPEIAREKAGILKPGVPAVVAPQRPEVLEAIREIAEDRGAPLVLVAESTSWQVLQRSLAGQVVRIGPHGRTGTEFSLPLMGDHQAVNAATAWTALRAAASRGLPTTAQQIARGFRQVQWPGRFEILGKRPALVLDAAHNLDSAEKLLATLEIYLPDRPLTLIFGSSADKDVTGFLAVFRKRTDRLIATRSTHPRAMAPETIARLAGDLGFNVSLCDRIEDALEIGLSTCPPNGVLLVTGSIFVAGAAREVWSSGEL